MMVAVLAITGSAIAGILASTYLQQANAQNQTGSNSIKSTNNNPSAGGGANLNWIGSILISSILSQTIRSKIHTTLIDAITIAQKAVGVNSQVNAARLLVERGFLIYSVWVRDSGNGTFHRMIVDAGNGKAYAPHLVK